VKLYMLSVYLANLELVIGSAMIVLLNLHMVTKTLRYTFLFLTSLEALIHILVLIRAPVIT
jgi:hypothetical protein